jgi:transcriptional regulator with XRE-family HTH domain
VNQHQIDSFYAEVGRRIRARRERSGLSQADLGATVGVSGSQIARYELGQQTMTLCRAHAIASALGMSTAALVRLK